MTKIKLQFNQKQYSINIPNHLIQILGWKKSNELFISIDKKFLTIKRLDELEV